MTFVNITKKVLKGAAIGVTIGFMGFLNKVADKKVLTDRVTFQPGYLYLWFCRYYFRIARGPAALGGLCGFAWYLLYD